MSLVTHKYTPAEMSDHELRATFAARGHTVDYLLKSLRDQIHSRTLSSFVITAPRGAGKSTVIHMVALRIREDSQLSSAWMPVVFPEEQFDVASLRDLLAALLRALSTAGRPEAKAWLAKVAAEPNDEQSQQLAITGLKEITRQAGKRLVVFVENLNLLLEECLDDQMKGTLRRLLMSDPFMMIIGSSVHVFDSLKKYHEAFFNYFGQVPLDRLKPEQVFELLKLRAKFDGNDQFLRDFPKQQPKIRAIIQLSGGNPRLVLMLYELLSQRKVTTIVQYLRRLVDELTPLLKDEMENLPPQQRKIIHALMERGGTAKPTELVEPTRLPLNAINTQLKRLKDAQIVELLGGGKGRAANYTVPDKLFAIWYQMRYLGQNRRRIELFVEVLRVWFEEEERLQMLRGIGAPTESDGPLVLRERATTAEYVAVSFNGTTHQQVATDLCISQWVKTDLREAAFAYADLASPDAPAEFADEIAAHTRLARWLNAHGNPQQAVEALDQIIAKGRAEGGAYWEALQLRGATKHAQADLVGAIADFTAVIKLEGAPREQIAQALINRGVAKLAQADLTQAIADYTTAVELDGAAAEVVARALGMRGSTKVQQGDLVGAIVDYTAVIELDGAPKALVAMALFNRGGTKGQQGDLAGAMADYTTTIELDGAPKKQVNRALVNRGCTKGQIGDMAGAIADCTTVIEMEDAPKELVACALYNRAVAFKATQEVEKASADLLAVLDLGATPHHLSSDSARIAATLAWMRRDRVLASLVLRKFSAAISKLPGDAAREESLRFLSSLASPEMKEAWPLAWRALAENQQPEIAAALDFLKPVCAILEGQDRALLDALPPEQREFAQSVLARFDRDER